MYGRGSIISGVFYHEYDQKEQRIETTLSSAGRVINKWVHTYDEKGNVVETAKYTEGGYLLRKEAYAYEFDSTGNWTKKTISKLTDRSNKPFFRPEEVSYRMISTTRSPATSEEADNRNKESRADDRPDDRKAFAPDTNPKQLRQVKSARKPHPDDRSDEPQRDGHQTASVRVAGDGSSDRSANSRYEQQ